MLTVRAAIIALLVSIVVYLMMRRQRERLSRTAAQLTRMLDDWQSNRSGGFSFENPHLVHCRTVTDCDRSDCPAWNAPGKRCWQETALAQAGVDGSPQIQIETCHECPVYRLSCPNELTELGESFNNLMFLLESEARRAGQFRAQMLEKEKMVAVGQMASGIAHEIGNPLSSISSIAQMLRRARSNEVTGEQLDLIETHIQRISGIVRQMARLARPSEQRWELADIGESLQEAVRLVTLDRRTRNIEIDFEKPKLPQSFVSRGELEQVFIGLALNAFDAMPDGGKLTIRASNSSGNIVIRFEDTGRGIEPEIGRRIFEPFFTTKEPGQGTGLGLAVSYGVIQKHGGAIDFASTVGQGTVFTITLPVWDKAPDM